MPTGRASLITPPSLTVHEYCDVGRMPLLSGWLPISKFIMYKFWWYCGNDIVLLGHDASSYHSTSKRSCLHHNHNWLSTYLQWTKQSPVKHKLGALWMVVKLANVCDVCNDSSNNLLARPTNRTNFENMHLMLDKWMQADAGCRYTSAYRLS